MKILIFNSSTEAGPETTSHKLAHYFRAACEGRGAEASVFNLAEAEIPLLDLQADIPKPVHNMLKAFRDADRHIWLTPLYHGSMTGAMKNCLDWLEASSNDVPPYLTDKIVGLICWADGGQAMQGINAMDSVAKALRAWVLPYSIPVIQSLLFREETGQFSDYYLSKLELFTDLLTRDHVPYPP